MSKPAILKQIVNDYNARRRLYEEKVAQERAKKRRWQQHYQERIPVAKKVNQQPHQKSNKTVDAIPCKIIGNGTFLHLRSGKKEYYMIKKDIRFPGFLGVETYPETVGITIKVIPEETGNMLDMYKVTYNEKEFREGCASKGGRFIRLIPLFI